MAHEEVYPKNIAMQNLLQQHQGITDLDIPDNIEQENEEIKQNKAHNEREVDQITNNYNTIDDETKVKQNLISYQMRRKVLAMELNVIKTFSLKELLENENDTWNKIHTIETCIGIVDTALDINNFVEAEKKLPIAESLSTQLMKKFKKVVNKEDEKKEEAKEPEEDIENSDYRSKVTVRGTEEDVTKCILKVKTALDNGEYNKAENYLLKADRMIPTKNARDLMKQVRAAKESAQNTDPIEMATECVEQVNIIKEEESKSEGDSVNVHKCLIAFQKALSAGNIEKAERMLSKAKRLDHSLDVQEEQSQIKAAKANKIREEIREKEIEKAKRECKTAGECLYNSLKACEAGDFLNAKEILEQAKIFDPMLNLEQELSMIKTKMASKSSKENKDIDKIGPQETVTESDMKRASQCLYNAKQAYSAGDVLKAQRNINDAKTFDPSLDLEPYLTKYRAEMASRSSTEINTVIPKKVPDTVTTYTKQDVESCGLYLKEADVAYQNQNFNETIRLLILAKSYYPCTKVNEMLENIEKCKEKNQAKPSHEIRTHQTEFTKEKQKEMEVQIERRRKEVVKKERSKMGHNYQPEMNKTVDDQEDSLDNKKDITDKEVKNETNRYKSDKDDNKEKSITKPPPIKEQVKNLISMAENAIENKKFEDAMTFLNTAEELHPTEQAKELLKNTGKILFSREESYALLNCYEFPVEANESDETEARKCIKIAQAAFRNSCYDRAEHFLLKSLRISENQLAKSFLETVLDAKAQYNNVTTETKNSYNEHANDHSVNRTTNEYKKCIELTTKAIAEGNLAIAEGFLSKAIRINPNDYDRKQLKNIQDVRASHPSSSLKSDGDLKREREAEMRVNFAVDALTRNQFHVSCHYLRWALEELPSEQTRELLREIQIQIDCRNGQHSRPKNYIMLEANKLLDKADSLIGICDFEKAESFLVVSWAMYTSPRTTSVHKNFLNARSALLEIYKKNNPGARNGGNSDNIYESDKLVESALDKYKNNKLEEAEMLLLRAAKFHQSVRIDKLLKEIKGAKNRPIGFVKKIYKKCFN